MGVPDHLTCLLNILHAVQEAMVGIGHGKMDWFKIEKLVGKGCILSSCLFNLYGRVNYPNGRLDEGQAAIKIARRIINNLRYADDTTLMKKAKRN